MTSDPFEVVPATLGAAVTMSGSDAMVTLTVENPNGYRLLTMSGGDSISLARPRLSARISKPASLM